MSKQSTVIAMFASRAQAENAIDALTAAGYSRDQISIVAGDHRKADDASPNIGPIEEVGGGMTSGTGAALGGLAGFLGGIVALAIPGIGPIIAAGPLAAGIMGAGLGAAAGGVTGALAGHGIPESEASRYSEAIGRGRVLVTLQTDAENVDDAASLLDRYGAVDIDEPADSVLASSEVRRTSSAPVDSRKLDLGPGVRDKQREREGHVSVYPGVTGSGPTPTS
jgi:hypothetical protein